MVRPKYLDRIVEFEREIIAPLLDAIDRRELSDFEVVYRSGIDRANLYHSELGKSYIRWKLPPSAAEDLDLSAPEGETA